MSGIYSRGKVTVQHGLKYQTLSEKKGEASNRLGIKGRIIGETQLPYKTAGALAMDGQVQFHPLRFTPGASAKEPLEKIKD